MKLIAQTSLGTLKGLGPLGDLGEGRIVTHNAFVQFTRVFSVGVGVLTISAGIWFIFQILSGAIKWMTSGGEKQALQNAHKHITNAILGLFVVVFSYALIGIVGLIFGINILSPIKSLLGLEIPIDYKLSPTQTEDVLRVPSNSRDAVPR